LAVTSETLIQAFATAIAHEEGFYVEGSVPQRSRNPGDLSDDGDVGLGVIETGGPMGAKITIYPTVDAGWAALTKKVARMLNGASSVYTPDLSIEQVGMKYSGDAVWGKNVAARLGVPATMTLAEYASQPLSTNGDNVQQAVEEG
jgi:hypothetical protein